MASDVSKVLVRSARKLDELSGNRISNIGWLKSIYYRILTSAGYYSDSHRDLRYEQYSFDGFKLLLDTNEHHQKGVSEGGIDHELSAFNNLIENGDTVFDLGANIGAFSIYAAANNKNSTIYAIEPEPMTFDHLKRNISLNSFSDRIKGLQRIVGDSSGTAELNISSSENQATHSLVQTTHHSGDTAEIEMMTLDSLGEEYDHPDVVKVDVEGAEKRVLEGMTDTLDNGVKILIDVHDSELRKMGNSPQEIFDILHSYGEIREVTTDGEKIISDISSLESPTTLTVRP